MQRTVLVIEDNPLTRKMLRLALTTDGLDVREAAGREEALAEARRATVDLVILDFVLPDSDGLSVLDEIRELAGAPELPALLVTGLVSRLDDLRARAGPHTQVHTKPIEPGELLRFVRAHFEGPERASHGRRVLLVDDDPLNLKLSSLHLKHAGYEVDAASSGQEGLQAARRARPDAIIADVLMPSMDGFAFCLEVRKDPDLSQVPVVLVSAAYVEAADQELARKVGADALVLRSSNLIEALEALEKCAAGGPPDRTAADPGGVTSLYQERMRVQLERQAARNETLARQAAIQATALSVIRGLSAALSQPLAAPRVVGDILVHCLDATGLSTGLLYLAPEDGVRLEAHFGIDQELLSRAAHAFGQEELLRRIMRGGQPVAWSADGPDVPAPARAFLDSLHQGSGLFVPFSVLDRSFGLLVLASDTHDLAEEAWLGFAASLSAQFGQTVALGQSLARLAASEERLHHVVSSSPSILFSLRLEGGDLVPSWISGNVQALTGYTESEALSRAWWEENIHPEDRDAVVADVSRLLDEGHLRQEYRFRLKDGQYRWLQAELRLLRDEAGGPQEAIGSWSDVTARKEAELRLLESESQYRLIFQSNPEPMWVFDAETLSVLAVNDAAVRRYQWSREEFRRMTLLDLHPEEQWPALKERLAGGGRGREPVSLEAQGQWLHRTQDGRVIDVEGGMSPIAFRGRDAWLVMASDVTVRKRLELQFLQAQKMESVGRLAGGVAHDFNNILGVISGYGTMLRRRVAHDERLARYADDILGAADRATNLTRQLLAFSRRQVLQPRVLALNDVVTEIEKMLRRLIGEDKELVTRLSPDLPAIAADAGQLEQVLMNLVVNACDAMPRGGRVLIQTATAVFEEHDVPLRPDVPAGRYAVLAVSDTGHGMPREVQARIFEPFYTTKEPGKGTGLGLATVHGIVQQSGGHVFAYSEVGHGTTFKVYLPATQQQALNTTPPSEESPPGGTETVLVVEDERALRELVKECLEESGYRVLEAENGAAALALSAACQERIDVMLTDVIMPGMGGAQLAAQVREQRPDLTVVYMSGYTDDAIILQGVLTEGVPFLEKPFTSSNLARRVREALDRRHTAPEG